MLVAVDMFGPSDRKFIYGRHTHWSANVDRRDTAAAQRALDSLALENANSVGHLYNRECAPVEASPLPESAPRPGVVAALKLIDGYEYQACEHPGWKDSPAYNFCHMLRHQLIKELPGYYDAEWLIG